MDETEEMAKMIRQFTAVGIESLNQLKVPLADMLRAFSAAQVDAYIDARERFLDNKWPAELADAVILGMVQRNIEFSKQVSEAIQKAQQNRANRAS